MDKALAYLEQCVIAKRLAWLNQNLDKLDKTDDPVLDGYRFFTEAPGARGLGVCLERMGNRANP